VSYSAIDPDGVLAMSRATAAGVGHVVRPGRDGRALGDGDVAVDVPAGALVLAVPFLLEFAGLAVELGGLVPAAVGIPVDRTRQGRDVTLGVGHALGVAVDIRPLPTPSARSG
jgi:hypothetical protein